MQRPGKQSGFSAVAGLLIIFIVAIIGGTGWYVWNSNKKTNDTLSQADKSSNVAAGLSTKKQTSQSIREIQPAEGITGWKEYKDSEYGFSFRYPAEDKWIADYSNVDPIKYKDQYSEGDREIAWVKYDCGNSCGYAFHMEMFTKESKRFNDKTWGEDRMDGNTSYSLLSKESVKLNGASGIRWEYKPKSNDNNYVNATFYSFVKGNFKYLISIGGSDGNNNDLTSIGEKVLSTLQF
jgi:hypothetical protein